MGSKGKNIFFSGSGHVEYQIQGNEAYDNIQSNILPLHIPTTPRIGSKGQNSFFSDGGHVAYQIKKNEA